MAVRLRLLVRNRLGRRGLTSLALFFLLTYLPLGTQAHGTFEANELEIHVLNDEGSDAIEPYGGYDITEAFIGFAHVATVGQGAAGDGVYFRLELYGDRNEAVVPQAAAEWSVSVEFTVDDATFTRTLTTVDGTTFTGDFDALLVEAEGRDTHVLRAFVGYEKAGLAPGRDLKVTRIESRVDGDLRDFAPGGIPVPGTDGAAEYPDPTAIEGRGMLVDYVTLQDAGSYVRFQLSAPSAGIYDVVVESTLTSGGQHIFVVPAATEGWTFRLNGTTSAPVAANGSITFRLHATQGEGGAAQALRLDVLTDVGGRAELVLATDGTLHGPGGLAATPPAAQVEESSVGGAVAAMLCVLGAVAVRRRF